MSTRQLPIQNILVTYTSRFGGVVQGRDGAELECEVSDVEIHRSFSGLQRNGMKCEKKGDP